MNVKVQKTMFLCVAVTVMLAVAAAPAMADMAAAKKWVDQEFQPSTLTKQEQLKEMEWFINAAKPFKGMNIKVVSETIATHEYEAKVLAKAFEEITGIQVSFDLIQEGDVIEKLQTQWASGENIYDGWINDSDLIGTHARYGYVVPLSDFMAGEGKDVTLPTLDVDDFMGKSFTTGPDGKLYQLPDQQFANLYWFRYDWFTARNSRKSSKSFTAMNWVCRSTGRPMRISPSFSPNKYARSTVRPSSDTTTTARKPRISAGVSPMPGCRWPVPATRAFRTASRWTNGAFASKAADRWVQASAVAVPPTDRRPSIPAQVHGVAPEICPSGCPRDGLLPISAVFSQRRHRPADLLVYRLRAGHGRPGSDSQCRRDPKWRMAPSPHGPYWEEGMKLGYQDCGSWTMLKSTPVDRRKAAWLFAQFWWQRRCS